MPEPVRATIYLDPALHRALRLKAADLHCSMSDIVNTALRESLIEDAEDLEMADARIATGVRTTTPTEAKPCAMYSPCSPA